MNEKYFPIAIVLLLVLVLACTQQQYLQAPNNHGIANANTEKANAAEAKTSPVVNIISPQENELIKSSTVDVEVSAENFNLVPVGSPVKEGEGHFHVWLDNEKKLGMQTKFTFENVASGKHTITAELVMSNHSSLEPKVTKTITINIESGAGAKQQETSQAAGTSEFTVEVDDNGFYPAKIQAHIGDKVKINFKFRDDSIYFAGLDVKGPFPTIKYKLHGQQPVTAEFTMNDEAKIDSYWPSSGVHKATLMVEVEK